MKSLLFLAHLSSSSALLPFVFGLLKWKKLYDLKRVVWITAASLCADGVSLLGSQRNINTWPVINLFLLVQFVFLFQLVTSQHKQTILRLIFFGCVAFDVVNFIFIQTPWIFNSYGSYPNGIVMILASLFYLYHLMVDIPTERVQTMPLFWIAFGALVYYGGTIFLFLFNNYLIAHRPGTHQGFWVVHNVLNILKNVFLFISLWMQFRTTTSRS